MKTKNMITGFDCKNIGTGLNDIYGNLELCQIRNFKICLNQYSSGSVRYIKKDFVKDYNEYQKDDYKIQRNEIQKVSKELIKALKEYDDKILKVMKKFGYEKEI